MSASPLRIQPDPHETVARLVEDVSGIALGRSKDYLLDARLRSVLLQFRLPDLEALSQRLDAGDAELLDAVVDRLTINESSFFRDATPFEALRRQALPEIGRHGPIRVWCAACAAGQEPYSLAMLMRETGLQGEILATDIAASILTRARQAVYSHFEVGRGVDAPRRHRFFEAHEAGWRVRPEIRGRVRFEAHNLVKDAVPGRFDLILCRNVLIYFDDATKARVLSRLADALRPGGYLMLGGTERSLGDPERFVRTPDGQMLKRR